MTWTDNDTEALREMEPCGGFVGCHADPQRYDEACEMLRRAADEIERLQARVKGLEAVNHELREVAERLERKGER